MLVQDRRADVWEALVMVADAAGGHWAADARTASIALSSDEDSHSTGIAILRDLQTVFGGRHKMRTEEILDALCGLQESAWRHFHHNGDPISDRDLSRFLRSYGIRSKDVWVEGRSAKGYTADDLRDAWERYVPAPEVREDREVRDGKGQTR